MSDSFYKGFSELELLLENVISKSENPQDILVKGAEVYVKDLRSLPKPYSKLVRANSKHMLDTMTYKRAKNNEVEVGAGVYWLRFAELGTRAGKNRKWSTPGSFFMRNLWERNKEKYQKIMIDEFNS